MKKKNIILLILLLIIGFASVSTTLVINGVIGVSNKKEDFNIIFTNAKLDGVERQEFIDSETKKTINYETNKLTTLEESTTLEYDVTNTSRIYDAEVSITCTPTDNDYISIEYTPNSMRVLAGETKSGSITTKLIKGSTEDKSIKVKCTLNATATERDILGEEYRVEYKETLLNGTDPVIKEGLVPVTIENDGTVKKADITSEWYKYEDKRWANAVILSDDTINYNNGDTIPEDNIESYFVWIPRYKYQIFDEGNYTGLINSKPATSIAKEIQVEFENKDTTVSAGSTKDAWLTHPAFTNFDTNGIWIGKFETTGTTSNITVKPGASSLKNITVGYMFKTAYNYKRELDSHMMKNTEWGAVAYLSHSKYGINKEVNINNNSNYLTGYSAVVGTDQSSYPGTYGTDATKTLPYNTETGYKASTTGNITGIYDMSGGALEYMAAYMDGYGVKSSGLSELDLTTYAKYLDKYSNASTITSWNKRILGDATGEMGPFYNYKDGDGRQRYHNNWYADNSYFVDSFYPWFYRGGKYNNGVLAGQFYFGRDAGGSGSHIGFRLVLAK